MSYAVIFQRNYDVLYNTFTIALLFNYLSIHKEGKKIFQIGILSVCIFLAQYSSLNNYHFYFDPEENYNGFKRLPNSHVEIFEVLNTKIRIEDYDRAIVVSQIPSVKGFVSNVYSVLDYNVFRSIDRYGESSIPSFSPLWNIFMPRDYYGQAIFSDDPDYENTCQYLIDSQVDFVLVDSLQFYMKDGDYVPLYLKVRDCAKEVYSNDRYILYQFYW